MDINPAEASRHQTVALKKREHFVVSGYHDAAHAAALKWFEGRDAGIADEDVTVAAACREYVTDRREKKSQNCAHDADKRFERTVYNSPFGALKVAKLRAPRFKEFVQQFTSNRQTYRQALHMPMLAVIQFEIDPGQLHELRALLGRMGAVPGEREDGGKSIGA